MPFAYGTLPQARMTHTPLLNGMAQSHHLGFLGVDLSVNFLPGILVSLKVGGHLGCLAMTRSIIEFFLLTLWFHSIRHLVQNQAAS